MAKFGEICRMIADGDWIESKDQSDEGIRLIQTGNIGNGQYLDKPEKAKYITLETFNRLQCKSVLPGDILISRLPDPVGRACEVPQNIGQAITAVDCTIVRLNSSICNDRYFLNYTQSQRYFHELQTYLAGTTRTRISRKNLEKIEVPLPSLDEQRHIAAVLDKVTDLIAQRRAQLDKLDLLVKSRFVEMFGDPEINPKGYETQKLGDLSTKISDGVHAKPTYTQEGRPFLSVVNINGGFINFEGCKFVSEEAFQKMIKSTYPKRGDVLYTKVGATYGIPAYVDTDTEFCLYVSVCLIKPKHEKINSRFLAFSMGMPYIKRQADRRIKGIGVPDLHLNQIREFTVVCPPMEEQDSFMVFVKQMEETKLTIHKSLDKLETMKNALMQEYFE